MHPINGAVSSIIDNKLYLPFLLKDYPSYCPEYYYYIDNRGLLPLPSRGSTKNKDSFEDFLNLLHHEGKLVAKHTHLQVGQGFKLIEYENGNYFVNKAKVTADELCRMVTGLDEYIVTEFVRQHAYSMEVNSSSVNTLRMLVVWNSALDGFELVGSFHRFGCNHNIVDNLGSGNGMLCPVDVATGRLAPYGFMNVDNKGVEYIRDMVCPATKKPLAGLQIPRFSEVRDKIIEISNHNRMLRWIAWDVVITDGGFQIIESNSLPDLAFVQMQCRDLKKRLQSFRCR